MKTPSFSNPVPYGNFKFNGDKNAELISYPGSKLILPYDGIVVYDMTPPCENYIKIKHDFNGKEVYSVFCNVKHSMVTNNDELKRGSIIGRFADDKIHYSIQDDNDSKKSLKTFFYYQVPKDKEEEEKEKSKKEKDTDKEKDSDKEKETIKKQKDKDKNKVEGDFEDLFLRALLSPLSIVDTSKKSKTSIKDLNLKEDIQRIKNLLK